MPRPSPQPSPAGGRGRSDDLAADLYGLARPRRLPRSTAENELPLVLLSFMSESRRLDNGRMKREPRLRLRYATVSDGLRAGVCSPTA